MEFQKFTSHYIIRIERDEEIVQTLSDFCENQQIYLGKISGIGAVKEAEIGFFEVASKQYHSNIMRGDLEITNLAGNISKMSEKPYLHLHVTLSNNEHKCFGGHLNRAIVSATCEIILEKIDGKIDRFFDEEIGLNLLQL